MWTAPFVDLVMSATLECVAHKEPEELGQEGTFFSDLLQITKATARTRRSSASVVQGLKTQKFSDHLWSSRVRLQWSCQYDDTTGA